MRKDELARQVADSIGHDPKGDSDDQVIGYVNRCCYCGKPAIPMDDLGLVIGEVKDVQEFYDRLSKVDKTNWKRAHHEGCSWSRSCG